MTRKKSLVRAKGALRIGLRHAILIAGAAIFVLPFYWLIVTSLKSDIQILNATTLTEMLVPDPVVFSNYPKTLNYMDFGRYFLNTTLVALLSIIGITLASSMVAFSFARLKWPGRDIFFIILLSTMMLPHQVTMIPLYLIYSKIGWVNSLKPLWAPSFFGHAFFIFLLRQFYKTIPRDFMDAAKIDGCNYFQIYWKIMFPLVRPAIITIVIFQFMWSWNDFLGPLIYIHDRLLMTMSQALQALQSANSSEWSMLMAASAVMTIPVIIVFFFAQRYFIQGVVLTGLKE
ncbi:carbohydrate ABC transporter permease [candidate division KSB1 bacterium]|nr:carbohydrate ABC transporter permease [candidate division KSB1 bacterium]